MFKIIFTFCALLLLLIDVSARKLIVGISQNQAIEDYNSIQSPDGISIELLKYIAEKENWDLEYRILKFQDCLDALENGEIDILPNLGYSNARSQIYLYNTIDLFMSWGQVYTHENSNINSILDLKGKVIAVVKNDLFLNNPTDGFLQLESKFKLQCKYTYVSSYSEVFELIDKKQVDAGIVNRLFGDYDLSDYKVNKTPIIFSPNHLYFAFPKNDKYLNIIQKIDLHMSTLKGDKNSLYFQLIDDYFNVKKEKFVPANIKIALIILLGVFLVSILFLIVLKRTIKVRTNQIAIALNKAKESDQLKSVFLRNLSHEVRTPMNGVIGFSTLLQDDNMDQNTRKRYTDLVISSSRQLLSIVDNVLAVSLIETKQEKLHIVKVNINDILEDLYSIFSKSLDEKNIVFTLKKFCKDENASIETDSNKLRQTLSILIGNAVKFTTHGFIQIGYRIEKEFVEFYIQDSGIGINSNMKDQIFTLFSQEDNSPQRKYEGAGLGLSIAKGYVELMGGQIYFESHKKNDAKNKDVSTTFYFTIPIINKIV